jgi:hypothetical protein
VDPTKIFDVGHGVAPTLPNFVFPATSASLRASYPDIHSRRQLEQAASAAVSKRFTDDFLKVARGPDQFQYQALQNVLNAQKLADTLPSVAPLRAAYLAADNNREIAMNAYEDQGGFHCEKTPQASTAIGVAWLAARPYLIERYRMQSALAANLSDPDAHAAAMDYAEMSLRSNVWDGTFANLDNTAYVASVSCPVPADPPVETVASPMAAPSSTPCPPTLQAVTFKIDFSVLSISARCQDIKIKLQSAGLIGVFGQVEINGATGNVTIFGGAHGGKSIPLVKGGPKIGADIRDGIYVKVGKSGIQDIGMRVEMKAGASWGGVSTGKSDSMDLSFVGAF